MGIIDPPREEAAEAVIVSKKVGMKPIMITGDHKLTAVAIAKEMDIFKEGDIALTGNDLEKMIDEELEEIVEKVTVYARVSPIHKLKIVKAWKKRGDVVAMTGDGVNDAPALKKADIGIAMGQRGTQVAREAADMVLKDDAFSTIVVAIRQGRIIFDNIRKFVLYLLSCNVSEIMIVSLASLVNVPLPILPLQILFLNLVTDVFPALALGASEGDPTVMERSPRDTKESILARHHWLIIGGYGILITISVLGAFAMALFWLQMDVKRAVTVSFLTLAFTQLWHVFNMRDRGSGFFRNEITRNPFVWGALALCTGLLLAAIYVPVLSVVLKVVHPGTEGWMLVIVMSVIPWVIGQIIKSTHGRKAQNGSGVT
jgi:Ca2+-transporting ATPase